ncbi:peroxidase-like isoform X1 [Limulus polyphemus]|uniref:Peroxidase-like isoform X1 n=2 Tax=Limulus polyphemus TaxID=6850 RepID=A0ABM1T0Q1_LIMPO|nr:peroxidase-like isoform X1 [Limulus polyphemus]
MILKMDFILWCQITIILLMLSMKDSVCEINSVALVPHDINAFGRSSGCALVLRRVFVDGIRKSSALPYKGFFNLIGPNFINNNGPAEEICIRYIDVNLALAEAKRRKGYRPPRTLNSLEPHPKDIGITGEVVLETTRILAEQFQLTRDEIINGLPIIDTSRTDIWEICPAHVKPVPCTIERFRSFTGICNNIQHSSWGSTHTPFVRFLPPAHPDGISAPRISVSGGPLPPARLISTFIHPDFDNPSGELSILVMSWGQMIDHDLTLASLPRDEHDLDFDCCESYNNHQHPSCMTIDIPHDDPFYSQYGQRCMDFKRLEAGQRPGCTLGPRAHINLDSSPIDGNFVYGSTEEVARKLRLGKGGLMRVWDVFSEYGLKPLPPPLSENPERDCTARPRHLFCFIAGDERINEQIHLTVIQTLYLRDHNRKAIELGRLNPHWDDERIYHETRHIAAASIQNIIYKEFLPMVLGEEMVNRYNLTLQSEGYWNGYDPNVHMGVANSFQAAAFRFGHTHIQGMVRRYNKFHEFVGEDPLRTLLRRPFIVYEPGKIDELIGGLINTPAQVYDPFITMEVTNHLFEEPPEPFGHDLISFNIARGRETGVPGYNDYREWCGLGRAKTFEDFEPLLNNKTALRYSQLYKHPDDIDLWSGGVTERRLPGAMIGPTFACIIARQFANSKRGDRFWHENSGFPSAFTAEQLQEIRKSSQSKLLCENADDLPTIQLNPMRLAHPIYNPRIPCKDLPEIDLRYWQEDPAQGGYPFKKK